MTCHLKSSRNNRVYQVFQLLTYNDILIDKAAYRRFRQLRAEDFTFREYI